MHPGASEAFPLTREDRAILDLECATIAGHTCKVVVAEGDLAIADLRTRIGAGVALTPELRWVLGGSADAPAWLPSERFDIAEHVRAPDSDGGPVPVDALPGEVSRLFAERLDRSRPLWAIDAIRMEGGDTALVLRVHHALADGTAAMRFARAILWDPEPGRDEAAERSPAATGECSPAAERSPAAAGDSPSPAEPESERRRRHLLAFFEHEFGESAHRSPFDGEIGTERRIAFASVPLTPLHDAAKALDEATLNDAVLAVAAGALRHWVETHHGSLKGVRARVPVSLHHDGDAAGNRDSFFTVALPLCEPDPVTRLRRVHAATTDRKVDHDAETMDSLLRGLAGISSELEHLCRKIESSPRRFAVSVSNVRGPREPVTILGAPVRSVHSLAEIGSRHALRISVVSLAGTLYFGFCADPHLIPDVEAMASGVETEGGLLVEAASEAG